MQKVHHYPITIKEHHLDTFGHVNNATYLEIFEEARWEYITQNGFGLQQIKELGYGPVILEINIKFLKELNLRQSVVISTENIGYEGKIGKLRQWIGDSRGSIYCEAEFKMGLFDTKQRKLILPTDEWKKAIDLD